MARISILASPPLVFPIGANLKVLNRLAQCVIVAGALIGGARLLSAPEMAFGSTAQQVNDQGAPAQAKEPQPSRAAPGLRNARPVTRVAAGFSTVSWGGQL